jgi:1-acyl-sn-glycerol-3-phosphate acyltransferase
MPDEKPKLPLLTRLGVPWLWGGDVEKGWVFMQYNVKPITLRLAPGSWAYGTYRIPASGGAVLAANLLSGIDPPLVGTFSRRALWYMMKAELLDIPIVGEALTWTGAFPVRRGEGDRDSLRKARELVREGHIVAVFVEGTRQRFGYPGPVHAGALTIAMKERVPVIPCGVESFGWSLKNRRACALVYGEPMSFDHLPATGRGYKEAGELLAAEILRLWREAAEAVAAGFPARLPDGTPRERWPRWPDFLPARTPRRVSGLA